MDLAYFTQGYKYVLKQVHVQVWLRPHFQDGDLNEKKSVLRAHNSCYHKVRIAVRYSTDSLERQSHYDGQRTTEWREQASNWPFAFFFEPGNSSSRAHKRHQDTIDES